MASLSNGLAGVTGEYYVCAELSHRGYLATLTLKNTEGVDILAKRPNSDRAISIQVKTTQSKGKWLLSKKNEGLNTIDFYIFVRIGHAGTRPDFHIVPCLFVASYITHGHAKWLSGKKRDGGERVDTSMRAFNDINNDFHEKWGLLE